MITSFALVSCQDEVVDELEVFSPSLSTDPDDEDPTGD